MERDRDGGSLVVEFCVFNFLSILSDCLSQEKLIGSVEAEQFSKLQLSKDKIDQTPNFSNCQMAIFVFISLQLNEFKTDPYCLLIGH